MCCWVVLKDLLYGYRLFFSLIVSLALHYPSR